MSAKNKVLARRWFEEIWNNRDDKSIADLLAKDAIFHQGSSTAKGIPGFRKARVAFHEAVPNARIEVEDVIADGNGNVAVRWNAAGKGTGSGPSRRKVAIRGLTWQRFQDGKLVEAWEHRESPGPRRATPPVPVPIQGGIGERLRQLRIELFGERGGPEMARKLGIPARTYYNYETGVTVPAEILLRIVEMTGVDPRWLMTGVGPIRGELPEGLTPEEIIRQALKKLEADPEPVSIPGSRRKSYE